MDGDTLLMHFTLWSGDGKPPIEITNNDFVVRTPGWDRNSSVNALEVVNSDNVPIFQMIRKNPSNITVNGIFPSPSGLLIIAGPNGLSVYVDKVPPDFVLRPIFKYPSWKYPGQYAE